MSYSYNTSVQLGMTAFLICKVAPTIEPVSKLCGSIKRTHNTSRDIIGENDVGFHSHNREGRTHSTLFPKKPQPFAQHFHFRIHHRVVLFSCQTLCVLCCVFDQQQNSNSFIPHPPLSRSLSLSSAVAKNKQTHYAASRQNQVSWVRRRDWHILSSGDVLYTNDARFMASHEPTLSTYTLQIKFLQARDRGSYDCTVRNDMKIEYEWG